MTISKTILTTLLFFWMFVSNAQNDTVHTKKMRASQIAKNQIDQLKNGALLVRLQTKQMSIDELIKKGDTTFANKIRLDQFNENLSISKAFRETFDFCPVFFFYSNYSSNIRNEEFDKIVFLNDSLVPDSNISLTTENVVIAEFATVKADPKTSYDNNYERIDSKINNDKGSYYGPGMGFSAVILMNNQFVQLRKPFPYYQRTREMFIKSKEEDIVKRLNKKLHSFYKSTAVNP